MRQVMVVKRLQKTAIILALAMVIFWSLFSLGFFFLLRRDRFLLGLERALQDTAGSYGLALTLDKKIQPFGPFGLVLRNLTLRDRRHPDQPIIFTAHQIYLRLSPVAFLRSLRHPQGAVVEVFGDGLRLVLRRDRTGAWWWERSKSTGGGVFHPLVRVVRLEIEVAETLGVFRPGRYKITAAGLDLRQPSSLRGWAVGAPDFDPGARLRLEGEWVPLRRRGFLRCHWEGADLTRWQRAGWLPVTQVRFFQGRVTGEVELAFTPQPGLGKGIFYFQQVRLAPADGRWPAFTIDGRAALANGLLTIEEAQAKLKGARFLLSGRIDLRRRDPGIEGEVSFSRLDPSLFPPFFSGLVIKGSSSGRLRVGGTLSRPSFTGRLSFAGKAFYPGLSPPEVELAGRFVGEEFIIDKLRVAGQGGECSGQGVFRWRPFLSCRLDLAGDGFEVGTLLPLVRGRLKLAAHLDWTLERWSLVGRTSWEKVTWQQKVIPQGRAGFSLRGIEDELRLTGDGSFLPQGEFSVALTKRGENWVGTGRLKEVRLAAWTPFLPPAVGEIDGELTGVFGWRREDGRDRVVFSGGVSGSVWAGRRFTQLKANLTWQGTEVIVETGQLTAGEGSISFHGRYDWRQEAMRLDALVHRFPLGDFLPEGDGWLEGWLRLAGTWPELTGEGRLSGAELAWRGVDLGLAEAEFTLARGRVSFSRLDLFTAGGRIELTGETSLIREGETALAGRFEALTGYWQGLFPGRPGLKGRLGGTVTVRGSFLRPEVLVSLTGGPGAAYGIEWDGLEAGLRWRDGRLAVEKAVWQKAGQTLSLRGEVTGRGYDLMVRVEGTDLRRVLPALPFALPGPLREMGGSLSLTATVGGSLIRPVFAGDLVLDHPTWRSWQAEKLAGRFSFSQGVLFFPSLVAVAGEAFYTLAGQIDFSRKTMALDFGVEKGDLGEFAGLFLPRLPWPVAGRGTGRIKLAGSFTRPVVEGALSLDRLHLAGWELKGELAGRYDGHDLVCDRLYLVYDGGALTATGRISGEEKTFHLRAVDLPLAEVMRLAGRPEWLRGRAGLELSFSRRAGGMEGAFTLRAASLTAGGIGLDRVLMKGEIRDRVIYLAPAEIIAAGHPLTLTGSFPLPEIPLLAPLLQGLPGGKDNLALHLEGKTVPAPLFNPLWGKVFVLDQGVIDVTARVAGTWERPELEGTIRLTEGAGTSGYLTESFSRLSATLLFTGDRVLVREAKARVGRGWLEMGGTLRFVPGGPDYGLKISGREVGYKIPAFFEGELAAVDLRLEGRKLPAIRGSIILDQGRITIRPQATPAPGSPLPAIPLDIYLSTRGSLRFSLPGLVDLPLKGEARLLGSMAAPALSGTVYATTGTVFLYGQHFTVNTASGSFLPERGYIPSVEMEATKRVDGVLITAKVYGEATETGLIVELSSKPELSRAEILDLLAGIGRGGITEDRPFAWGMEFLVETVFGPLGEDVGRFLALDRFRISFDEDTGRFLLQLGKYFQDKLYLSYEVALDDLGRRNWGFDYYFHPSFVLSGTFGSDGRTRWSIAYRWKF